LSLVLVTGGTGVLGRRLVPRLVSAGHDVRIVSRRDRPERPDGVEAARGDVRTGEGLDRALHGVDTVVHCATSPVRRARQTEVRGTGNVMESAARSGRPHLIYMSIVGVDRHPFPYYRAKRVAERLVEQGALPYTVLRATQFHERLHGILDRAARVPVVLPCPRGFRFQPVAADEVAARVVELVAGGPEGRVPDVGGPEVRAADDLARAWLRATGRRRRVVRVPLFGRAARAFKQGVHLCPSRAVGTTTWEQWLARARSSATE
jgi:uncharacterized protein YbjT (DUF2867 family)